MTLFVENPNSVNFKIKEEAMDLLRFTSNCQKIQNYNKKPLILTEEKFPISQKSRPTFRTTFKKITPLHPQLLKIASI